MVAKVCDHVGTEGQFFVLIPSSPLITDFFFLFRLMRVYYAARVAA